MKKILLIFSNSSVKGDKADPERLIHLLQNSSNVNNLNLKFYYTFGRSISYLITNDRVKIRDHRNHLNLNQYDFVYFRKAGSLMQQMLVIAKYLEDVGIPFWDKEIARASSRNKLSQMYMLRRDSLSIPATLFCRNKRRLVRLVSTQYSDIFKFPLIAKATGGTRGGDNYLVSSIEELDSIIKSAKRQFIIQEFIPNDCDYRYFIADRVRGIIKRSSSESSHLNNTSQGGSADMVGINELGELINKEAVKAALIFSRNVAGVDIIQDKITKKHYFLEVNRAPQIEGASFESEKADWMTSAISEAVDNYMPSGTGSTKFNGRPVIGRFEAVLISGINLKIIAKIDTGADTSSLHCDSIKLKDNILIATISGKSLEFQNFQSKNIKSSNGQVTMRYVVKLSLTIGGANYEVRASLSDRSEMTNQMLLGRRFLRDNKLMVDVGRRFILTSANRNIT